MYGYKFDFTVLAVNFKYEQRFAEIGIKWRNWSIIPLHLSTFQILLENLARWILSYMKYEGFFLYTRPAIDLFPDADSILREG